MSSSSPTAHPEWLVRLASRGFRLVFYPAKQKGPTGTEAKGWSTRVYTLEDYRPGLNVGCMLGTEVAAGKFLCDVDFDWAEGVPLARKILPPTGFGFGRGSRKITHAFYTTSQPVKSRRYENIDGKPFLELRGTKVDGSIGLQTMLPPSVHPSEEQVELRSDEDIAHDDEIERRCTLYAMGCMLYAHFGSREFVHDVRLAVAGFLLSLGLSEEEAMVVCESVCEATGNNVGDMRLAIQSTAVLLKGGGDKKVAGANALVKALGDHGKKILARMREWVGEADFIYSKNDTIIKDNLANIRRAIEKMNVNLTWDTFADHPLITWNATGVTEMVTDKVIRQLWFGIEKQFNFRPGKDLFNDVVLMTCEEHEFHPVREYFDTLQWDGKPRLDRWLVEYGAAADNDYTRAVGRIVLLAAVRRIRSPGCKFDELLILESEQGLNKSTAVRSLCPKDEWFGDSLRLDVDPKQLIEMTARKWIIEVPELSGMQSAKTEQLKAMLSRQWDGPVRLAFTKLPVEKKRQFVLIATSNSHVYLSDMTGNRRFWPVRVETFDVTRILKDRDQIWAEASHREAKGESIRLPEELYHHAGVQQDRRREADPWEAKLSEQLVEDYQRVTTEELWIILGIPTERRSRAYGTRLSQIMQLLGFRRMSVFDKEDSKVKAGWGRGRGQRDGVEVGLYENADGGKSEG